MITITDEVLRKVNAIRRSNEMTEVSADELQRLMTWNDLPHAFNLTQACLQELSEVLGYTVANNADGGMVYLCVDSEAVAREIAIAIDGLAHHWTSYGPMGPQHYLGHTVLLPDDLVALAKEASREVLAAWRSR